MKIKFEIEMDTDSGSDKQMGSELLELIILLKQRLEEFVEAQQDD
jgi:hypothetical protein